METKEMGIDRRLRHETMQLRVTLFWILNIRVMIGVSVGSDEPENVAVNSEERSSFTCKTNSNSKLRWSMRLTGENEERILTREGQILPSYAVNYSIEASNGQLTLIVKNTSSHDAGRYICLELSSSKTASAELIVIESAPVCNSTQNTSATVFQCVVRYRGNWRPDIDLSIRQNNTADIRPSPEQLMSQLVIPHSKDHTYYACTSKFSKNGKTTFEGENVNDVIGTVARNIPEYSATTDCNHALIINYGLRAHLATGLLAISTVVLASLL